MAINTRVWLCGHPPSRPLHRGRNSYSDGPLITRLDEPLTTPCLDLHTRLACPVLYDAPRTWPGFVTLLRAMAVGHRMGENLGVGT